MSLVNNFITCNNIQTRINDLFTGGDPTLPLEPMDYVRFLQSAQNTNNILQRQISPRNGKVRTVEVAYTPRLLESVVEEGVGRVCESDNYVGDLTETYTIDPADNIGYHEGFDATQLILSCEDNEDYLYRRLAHMINVMDRRVATRYAEQTVALTGAFAADDKDTDGTSITGNTKQVQTAKANGDISHKAIREVNYSFELAGYPTNYAIVGFGDIYKYYNELQAGCCANDGLDLGRYFQQNGFAFLKDRRIDVAFDGNFIGLLPGALQILTYNEFAVSRSGRFDILTVDTDTSKRTVIYSPYTGIGYDMMYTDDNCGTVTIQLKLATKLVGMPNDMFAAGDRLNGFTGVLEFAIANPAS